MIIEEFAKLVQLMRQTQRDYFRERSSELLTRSKELEKRVDKEAHNILHPPPKNLFEGLPP